MTAQRLRDLFGEISRTYDLSNHVLTFGLDTLWRRKAAGVAAEGGGITWLDMCAGTGKMARQLLSHAGRGTAVVAADFCMPMMRGADRMGRYRRIHFVAADADALPFPDDTFDLITLSFGIRNLHTNRHTLLARLREFHRVLKRGGRFVSVETSQPSSRVFRWLLSVYVRIVVKPVGYVLSGSKEAYGYLAHTIPRFYSGAEFRAILREAGFTQVKVDGLTFGVVAVHRAVK